MTDLTAERWQKVKDIFQRALELAPAQRAELLRTECGRDEELHREVEALLANHDDDFLEQPAGKLFDQPPPSAALSDGQPIGHYRIKHKLGQGGMGIVYLAEDTRLGRLVSMKALAPEYTSDEQLRERLRREARLAATLSHPAIATVYALEELEGEYYIISEYVRGRTLAEEIASGPLPWPRLLDTAREIAAALAAAHQRGVIHRDLKPENLLRTESGGVKVLDFGLARKHHADPGDSSRSSHLTQAGLFLGTPAYASPEQLLGRNVDIRTDIFSFGILLYEMATGRHPYAGADSISTMARILEAEPSPVHEIRSDLPSPMATIIHRCLRKNPGERYTDSAEIVTALASLDDPSAPPPKVPPLSTAAPPREHPLWWWQFHQAAIGLIYYAMLIPMWKVKSWTAWGPPWGAMLFFAMVAAVAVGANLRFHLWFTSGFYPGELDTQRRSVTPWIRSADMAFVLLLLIGSLAIYRAHEVYTTLLVAVAIGCLCAFLLIEPTTARAAFGRTGRLIPARNIVDPAQK